MRSEINKILITGGAGFVGSSLAIYLKNHLKCEVICLDNLVRKGSELQVDRLSDHGISFVLGDVRNPLDLREIHADLMIECSAEPSVMAGLDGDPSYLVDTNLKGCLNCLEWQRQNRAGMIFLSTSRVYPIAALENISYVETDSRFIWDKTGGQYPGDLGISLDFCMKGSRSLYGATKLASEIMIEDYAITYDLPSLITRFGVIAGPWQMGKVDQGFAALWMARHCFSMPLSYNGYGGLGKQVRDILDIEDVCTLILLQIQKLKNYRGECVQAAGSLKNSVSLLEMTRICEEISQKKTEIRLNPQTHGNDVRILALDPSSARKEFGWERQISVFETMSRIHQWILAQKESLKKIFVSG